MPKSLYVITEEYNQLMFQIEEQEGVLEEYQAEALAINERELQTKSVAYLEFMRSKEGMINLRKEEIKRQQAAIKREEKIINLLKKNLVNAVNLFGEFEVGTVKFSTRKSSSVVIEDEDQITKDYQKTKVTISIDKAKIKKALSSGEKIPGARLSSNQNLSIK